MNCHGFPKACDHKYLFDHCLDRFDHRVDRFDHRLSKRCSALGCIDTLPDWSTFKSAAGTVPNSYPHSRACIKSNTHSYADSEPDTITRPSTCRNASPTFTPPQIALHPVQVIRVYDADGNLIETHEHAGVSKSGSGYFGLAAKRLARQLASTGNGFNRHRPRRQTDYTDFICL
jgi:hypothetical protein